ncbi:hypothetical protein V8C37DRAFT_366372 [Trichoderma ceciliae]
MDDGRWGERTCRRWTKGRSRSFSASLSTLPDLLQTLLACRRFADLNGGRIGASTRSINLGSYETRTSGIRSPHRVPIVTYHHPQPSAISHQPSAVAASRSKPRGVTRMSPSSSPSSSSLHGSPTNRITHDCIKQRLGAPSCDRQMTGSAPLTATPVAHTLRLMSDATSCSPPFRAVFCAFPSQQRRSAMCRTGPSISRGLDATRGGELADTSDDFSVSFVSFVSVSPSLRLSVSHALTHSLTPIQKPWAESYNAQRVRGLDL